MQRERQHGGAWGNTWSRAADGDAMTPAAGSGLGSGSEPGSGVEKLLPQDVEAEMSALGSILIDPLALDEVADALSGPEDFYRTTHRTIYAAMLDVRAHGAPVDLIMLRSELMRLGQWEDVGGSAYVTSLINHVPSSVNARHYATLVADAAARRRVIHYAGQVAALAYQEADVSAIRETAEVLWHDATAYGAAEGTDIADTIDVFLDECEEAYRGERPPGITTGFHRLDAHMYGLRPGDLVYMCGRPGCFKSTIAAGIAERVARTYGCVEWMSLEMTDVQQVKRMIAALAQVDGRIIRAGFRDERGALDHETYETVMATARQAREELRGRVKFHAQSLSLAQLRQRATRAVYTRGSKLLIVDYIGLVRSDDLKRRPSENERITQISQELKQLALTLRVPILCLVQMNREAEKRLEHRPRLSDLRDSGALEQDADFVIGIYRAAAYNATQAQVDPRYRQYVELIMLKARDGVAENVTIPLRVEAEYTRPSDWPSDWPYEVYKAERLAGERER